MEKFKTLTLGTVLSLLALSSCSLPFASGSDTSTGETTSQTGTSNEVTSSSSTSETEPFPIPDSSTTPLEGNGLMVTLGREYISEGTSFLDATDPYVSFRYNGVARDLTSAQYKVKIVNDETGEEVAKDELLEAGLYKVTISYTYASETFNTTVYLSVRPHEAETDKGYEKVELTHTLAEDQSLGVFGPEFGNYSQQIPADAAPATVGSPKFLIVPISFRNEEAWQADELADLNDAYLSTDLQDRGGFYSVHEFYYRSSYGKLDLDIEIADPFVMPLTSYAFQNKGDSAMNTLLTDFVSEFATKRNYDFNNYDEDRDGYIDGIHFVYKLDRAIDGDFWWNYTTFVDYAPDSVKSPSGQMMAAPCVFFFSAYESMMSVYHNIPDSHTVIHETGHMLGADDYYSYDMNEAPAGGSDMMDLNVGDHGAYTKMLFGWVDPYVINGESEHFEITLRPFEESGDVIVLRNSSEDPFNGTPFDEYLTLSYYTPTGLNGIDSQGFPEWQGVGAGGIYSLPGLQVFHVDARTGVDRGGYFQSQFEYIDPTDFDETSGDVLQVAASNTASYSASRNIRLIEAVASDGKDHFAPSYSQYMDDYLSEFGNNEILFGLGSSYGGSTYGNSKFKAMFPSNGTFNDGTLPDYSFRVVSMDERGLTLRFDANAA